MRFTSAGSQVRALYRPPMTEPAIIFETADFLVLNKPAGLSVHGDGFSTEKTLADWLLDKYPDLKEVGEPMMSQKGVLILKPGLVHRLDRDTSGVLLVAKNQVTFLFFKQQFQTQQVQKTYRAILFGELKIDPLKLWQTIDIPIGRSSSDPRRRVANLKAVGALREAVTDYRVLKSNPDFTYIEAKPKTGRTHQLRVHFKAINHPIVGDKLYAPKLIGPETIKRQALHALNLTLKLPSGESASFESLLPNDFNQTLDSLGLAC